MSCCWSAVRACFAVLGAAGSGGGGGVSCRRPAVRACFAVLGAAGSGGGGGVSCRRPAVWACFCCALLPAIIALRLYTSIERGGRNTARSTNASLARRHFTSGPKLLSTSCANGAPWPRCRPAQPPAVGSARSPPERRASHRSMKGSEPGR